MHANKNDEAITVETPGYVGKWSELGDMHFAFETCTAGYSMDDLLTAFPDRACPVEHWGYLFRGEVRVAYTDGTEEFLTTGDAFHIKPGHRPYMTAETELLQLTRVADHQHLVKTFSEAGLLG
ncbi:hypothetical protein OHT61_32000 [Streptomyces sp. NBC_00178]|uniref:hypothetical protein n=1 Tax=Streptomyces sp. NBC_00178 TaxID=2975672 RepID=UPI002E2D5C57|nr:hypothetical protein [Streptomyces sp. NBC_00178]